MYQAAIIDAIRIIINIGVTTALIGIIFAASATSAALIIVA